MLSIPKKSVLVGVGLPRRSYTDTAWACFVFPPPGLSLDKIYLVNWISFAQFLGVAPCADSIPALTRGLENWLPETAAQLHFSSITKSCLEVCWMVPANLALCRVWPVNWCPHNAITCQNPIQILCAMKDCGIFLCQPPLAWALGKAQAIKQHAFTIEHYARFAIALLYATTLSEVSVSDNVTTCSTKCFSQS